MSQQRRKRKSNDSSRTNGLEIDLTAGPSSQRNEEQHEELIKKCVRFLLTKMCSNVAIKRQDIVQQVFHEKPGKLFEPVLQSATKTLKKVYGLDVDIIDADSSSKKYFVTNYLPYAHLIPRSVENDMKSVLTFLILTHIFMCQNRSTESELWQFLKEFDITPESNIEEVGSIKPFIAHTLVRQNFIHVDDKTEKDFENEQKKIYYMWGSRADETVSKMDILKFVCEVYGTPDVKFWNEQYKDAKAQFAGQNQTE